MQALPWLLDNLIDVETPEDLARELVEQAMRSLAASDSSDSKAARTHLIAAIGREIEVAGPILSLPGSAGWWPWLVRPESARPRPPPS